MGRATLLVLATLAVMLVATGVALAATLYGSSGNDVIYGTTSNDTLNLFRNSNGTITKGSAGSDAVFGRPGDDTIYGGSGDDNFKNIAVDGSGIQKTAGLRGNKGNDWIYGGAGDDDLIGHDGIDTLDDSAPSNINDWDRAFGDNLYEQPGNDDINVADRDTRDEVSCGENTQSTTDSDGDHDKVTIDVVRDSSGNITAADKVYEQDANGNSTWCEVVKVKDQKGKERTLRDEKGTYEQLPQSASETAPAEPSSA